MADDDLELEVKSDGGGGNKKMMIMMIVIVVLVAVIAVGVTVMLVGGDSKAPATDSGAQAVEETKAASLQQTAVYYDLRPPFVVNYHTKGRLRYLQVHVEIMARSEEVIEAVKLHLPLIKNNLVTLFSSQNFEEIQDTEGKEKLREAALEEVQRVMIEQTGEPGVEAVLFTSFVVQ